MGVVGTLQFDVLDYRLKNEYGVDLYVEGLPYEYLRWVEHDGDEPLRADDLILPNDAMLVEDYKGNQLLLFASLWSINWTAERNKQLTLLEFGGQNFKNSTARQSAGPCCFRKGIRAVKEVTGFPPRSRKPDFVREGRPLRLGVGKNSGRTARSLETGPANWLIPEQG